MSHFHEIQVDPDLIARGRNGDTRAREAIYRAYASAVFTLARRLVSRPAVAEEVLQETFIEVLRNLHAYRGDGSFSGWIRTIAVHKCMQYLRSPWHRSLVWIDAQRDADTEAPFDVADDAMPTDNRIAAQTDLTHALMQLTPTSRAVVWLHDVEGFTHQEIAKLLNRTPSFSKSQLSRAHERLRLLLNDTTESLPCTPVSTNC